MQEGKKIEGLKLVFEDLKLVSRQDGKKRPAARTSKLAGSQQCSKESKAASASSAQRESKKGQEQEQEGRRTQRLKEQKKNN